MDHVLLQIQDRCYLLQTPGIAYLKRTKVFTISIVSPTHRYLILCLTAVLMECIGS